MQFNIANDDSLLVQTADGSVIEISLRDTLVRAHEFAELRPGSPLETVSLLRLMLAVLYAALDGPRSTVDWQRLWRAGTLPADKINAYLDRWQHRFELFDAQYPFLQTGGLEMKGVTPITSLSTEEATGNNPTLFSHERDSSPTAFTPAQAFRKLLTAQAFALGFGRAAEATVNGETVLRPYLADAPCLRGLTIFLSGGNLFQTLMLNLPPLDRKEKQNPLWQNNDPLSLQDKQINGKRIPQKHAGVLDRYVWQSRMMRLLPDDDGWVRRMYFTQGREADKSEGDPMKLFFDHKTLGRLPISLNANRASWRDTHTLLLLGSGSDTSILRNAAAMVHMGMLQRQEKYGLNVVGLATDPGKAGKFLMWRHDRMSLPAALLENQELMQRVKTANIEAQEVADEIRNRFARVVRNYLPPAGNPDPKDVDRMVDALDPRRSYWPRLEDPFAQFLLALPDDATGASAEWQKVVDAEAERALRAACDLLGTETINVYRAIGKAQIGFRFTADAQKRKEIQAKATAKRAAKSRLTPSFPKGAANP